MGNKITAFSEGQLEAYQDCTFFAKKDILRQDSSVRMYTPQCCALLTNLESHQGYRVFGRFQELDPNRIPYNIKTEECAHIKLPVEAIESIPELKENPFRRRICEVFSDDGTGNMAFDDFLNMFSVFSEAASRDIKATYAFQIYDYDCDNYLGKEDLENTLVALTQNALTSEEVDFIVDKVLEETDLDDDGMLSYSEFEHVISRAPEFISTFHIRI